MERENGKALGKKHLHIDIPMNFYLALEEKAGKGNVTNFIITAVTKAMGDTKFDFQKSLTPAQKLDLVRQVYEEFRKEQPGEEPKIPDLLKKIEAKGETMTPRQLYQFCKAQGLWIDYSQKGVRESKERLDSELKEELLKKSLNDFRLAYRRLVFTKGEENEAKQASDELKRLDCWRKAMVCSKCGHKFDVDSNVSNTGYPYSTTMNVKDGWVRQDGIVLCLNCMTPEDRKEFDEGHFGFHPAYECPVCKEAFRSEEELTKHRETIHVFRCEKCDAKFYHYKDLTTHIIQMHPIICLTCGEKFATDWDLKSHNFSVHRIVKSKDRPNVAI